MPGKRPAKARRPQTHVKLTGAILLLAAAAIIFGGLIHAALPSKEAAFQQSAVQKVFPPGTPVLHVLFLGNSYTFVNNLPQMVAAVAASDAAPVDIETGM